MASSNSVNIIRKIEVIEGGGHHGGAWKVAYADFMTAMMAFFLLMWILSSSDEQKLKGIAEYFTNATLPGGSGVLDGATLGPPGTLSASNGATIARGSDLGEIDDETPALWEVKDTTPTSDPTEKSTGTNEGRFENPAGGGAVETRQKIEELRKKDAAMEFPGDGGDPVKASQSQDEQRFEKIRTDIMQAIQESPDLRPLKKNVVFERTLEGLRIQIVDQDGQPMFVSGNNDLTKSAKLLIAQLGMSLKELPNDIFISGHTDSVPFADSSKYDNWDLSAERANSLRRLLVGYGIEQERIIRVSGLADTDPLYPDKPEDPANRRISVLLAYEKPAYHNSSEFTETGAASDSNAGATSTSTSTTLAVDQDNGEAKALPNSEEVAGATNLDALVFENLRSALQ